MASGTTDKDTTCTCLTEQGTKAKVRLPVCVAIARDGSAYNPCSQDSPMKTFPIELGAIGGARCRATSGVKHGSRSTRPNYCWAEAYDHFPRMPLVQR